MHPDTRHNIHLAISNAVKIALLHRANKDASAALSNIKQGLGVCRGCINQRYCADINLPEA
jgi:hypothetical protein